MLWFRSMDARDQARTGRPAAAARRAGTKKPLQRIPTGDLPSFSTGLDSYTLIEATPLSTAWMAVTTPGVFGAAAAVALRYPLVGLGMCCGCLIVF
jgi:hypothetical protein